MPIEFHQAFKQVLVNAEKTKRHHVDVPVKFWCYHYLDKKKRVTPDGADCCFMHWIGLPQRWGVRHPLYTWQERLLRDLFNEMMRFYFVLKPSKIGATEFFLRWGMHQALINPTWQYGQVAILAFTSGGDEARNMVHRCRVLLEKKGIPYDRIANRNEFFLNTVKFRAFPGLNKHVNSVRGQPNMKMIIMDEAAFTTDVDQQNVRDSAEHYILGSDAIIAVITTAGDTPSGFAYDIYNEKDSIYVKHILDYHAGMEVHPESKTSLYNKKMITEAKKLKSFQKNYMHQWGYASGDIFNSDMITLISAQHYDIIGDVHKENNCLFIDPAYGQVRTKTDSKFAILGMVKRKGIVYTNSLTELETPSDEDALAETRRIIKQYKYTEVVTDGAWPGIISSLRKDARSHGYMFGELGLDMTDNAALMTTNMEVRIHPTHEILAQQLRAIVRGDNGLPDKKKVRFDAGDCFLMGCWRFKKQYHKVVEFESNAYPNEEVGGFGI